MILLLSTAGISNAMEPIIELPSAQILRERLQAKGLSHFAEKTEIDKELGNQKLYPSGVVLAVEQALYDYDKYMKMPAANVLMQRRKPQILEALLQDHPEAIINLKTHGFLQ
jgi:hypothetical protein